MFEFIKSFLEKRTFPGRLHKTLPSVFASANGTPLGSVISHTLFNIMVNDLNTV